MREDLSDDDIYGREKLKRSILEAWYNYYTVLKIELEVIISLLHSTYIIRIANNDSAPWGKFLILPMLGALPASSLISQ